VTNAQRGSTPTPAPGEGAIHTVHNRWLPPEIHNRQWTDITDVRQIAEGDWIFNPATYAHYAGRVTEVRERTITVHWYKGVDNEFNEPILPANMSQYWRMQGAT
jgi:hypothetical protein